MPYALATVPLASRVWFLPFLSALAYSERHAQEQGKRHKTLIDWAWQLLLLVIHKLCNVVTPAVPIALLRLTAGSSSLETQGELDIPLQ